MIWNWVQIPRYGHITNVENIMQNEAMYLSRSFLISMWDKYLLFSFNTFIAGDTQTKYQ